jgi:hypothetical protein
MVYTLYEESVSDGSLVKIYDFFSSHAIRHDQQNKKSSARQIHNT